MRSSVSASVRYRCPLSRRQRHWSLPLHRPSHLRHRASGTGTGTATVRQHRRAERDPAPRLQYAGSQVLRLHDRH